MHVGKLVTVVVVAVDDVMVVVIVLVLVEVLVEVLVLVLVEVEELELVLVLVLVEVAVVVVELEVEEVVVSAMRTGTISTSFTSTATAWLAIADSTRAANASFFIVTSTAMLPHATWTSRTSVCARPVDATMLSIVPVLTASRSALPQSAYRTKLTTVGLIVVAVVVVTVCNEGQVLQKSLHFSRTM